MKTEFAVESAISPDFYGLPTSRIENDSLALDFLTTAGPRIVRLFYKGVPGNLLAETPIISWQSRFGEYHVRGGHRLWLAPESFESSIPDDDTPHYTALADGVCLEQPLEKGTGLRKTLKIHLHPARPLVTIDHVMRNEGSAPFPCSAWGITMLRGGGEALMPLRPTCAAESYLSPDYKLVIWPYSSLKDERLILENEYAIVTSTYLDQALKIGTFNPQGILDYRFENGLFFRKSFAVFPSLVHPEMGCNCAIYARNDFIEIESMSPIRILTPGEEICHTETWKISKK